MYAGLKARQRHRKQQVLDCLQLHKVTAAELQTSNKPIVDWLQSNDIKHLAIHLDLDVLDPRLFRSLLFAQPDGTVIDAAQGEMTLAQVGRIIRDVSAHTDVVGLAIAEHLPWDAINLHDFLDGLPILQG